MVAAIFDSKRPMILNGITEFVERPDLLERSIQIRHPPIPEEKRQLEKELWQAFDAAHPKILGAALDRVAAGLRELPQVKLNGFPRMADFAVFSVACESGSQEEPRFQASYAENQSAAHEQALDSSPLPGPLLQFMEGIDEWRGTPRELFDGLVVPSPAPKDWPKQPNILTGKLRRLAPDLRRVHRLNVDCDGRTPGGNRRREVVINRLAAPEKAREVSSPSSRPSRTSVMHGERRDGSIAVQPSRIVPVLPDVETDGTIRDGSNSVEPSLPVTGISSNRDGRVDESPTLTGSLNVSEPPKKPRRRYRPDDRPHEERGER